MTVFRKVVTSHEYPPIPTRSMDWLAYFDGDEEGPQGWGPTEEAAIADLVENAWTEQVEPTTSRESLTVTVPELIGMVRQLLGVVDCSKRNAPDIIDAARALIAKAGAI